MKPGTMAILLLAAMALPPRLMQADTYAFKVLDVTGSPTGINNSGQIVTTEGVLESNGTFTPINLPGSTRTLSLSINDTARLWAPSAPAT